MLQKNITVHEMFDMKTCNFIWNVSRYNICLKK